MWQSLLCLPTHHKPGLEQNSAPEFGSWEVLGAGQAPGAVQERIPGDYRLGVWRSRGEQPALQSSTARTHPHPCDTGDLQCCCCSGAAPTPGCAWEPSSELWVCWHLGWSGYSQDIPISLFSSGWVPAAFHRPLIWHFRGISDLCCCRIRV